ncbi:TetR family transcriptional regulator [Aldersonia sp. NBC_00410]|uniref:TetR/AcrR family transcriptional regulator n=1 Tax=Aldersonia sp. NBC_00410 TaxID=2975954 RepID=UPI002257BD69|nr:TetR family transcriptional regulator [Aldersonia sp. NBC_00410]MCX5043757.1 TetR family transcriptional regulator [Aldersonia sp. NBC_00410]
MRSNDADLSTKARIRDAAIEAFGTNGFATGVRAISTAAGVSPGLVIHHFGSKDGLRVACDERVLEIIRDQKLANLREPGVGRMLTTLIDVEEYAPVVAYMVRSFTAGGPLAQSLFTHMVDDAEQYLAEGVEAGVLRPSLDPHARAHYLTLANVGAMILDLQLRTQPDEAIDFRDAVRRVSDAVALPALELYTQGLLTDSTMLGGYLAARAANS